MYDDLDTDERPLVLTWELTQACELACKHCQAEADPLCAFVPERYDGPLPDAWGGNRTGSGTGSADCGYYHLTFLSTTTATRRWTSRNVTRIPGR